MSEAAEVKAAADKLAEMNATDLARQYLLGELMATAMRQLRAVDKPWLRIPEEAQRRVMLNPGDTPVDQAVALLDAAEIRVVEAEPFGGQTDMGNRPEIFHDGKWKSLHRTDLCDDVQTGFCSRRTAEEWRAHYRAKIRIGARIGPESFACIDSVSDG